MYARIAKFEGADPEGFDAIKAEIESGDGPPPGIPAKRIIVIGDRSSGTTHTLVFFETEEDMATGDATLNEMTPPSDAPGRRASVDLCEVIVERSVD
jgi:hypothetical protein